MDEAQVRRIVREELKKDDPTLKFSIGDQVVINFSGDIEGPSRAGQIVEYAGDDNSYDYRVDLNPVETYSGGKVYVHERELELREDENIADEVLTVLDLTEGHSYEHLVNYASALRKCGHYFAADVMGHLAQAKEASN